VGEKKCEVPLKVSVLRLQKINFDIHKVLYEFVNQLGLNYLFNYWHLVLSQYDNISKGSNQHLHQIKVSKILFHDLLLQSLPHRLKKVEVHVEVSNVQLLLGILRNLRP